MEEKIEINLRQKFKTGLEFGVINLGVLFLLATVFRILENFGVSPVSDVVLLEDLQRPLYLFLLIVVLSPPAEELLFRFAPIRITGLITKNKYILWSVIILVSLLFGAVHGSWHHIFLQGISGIIFSVAFLRDGLMSSTVAHASTNFVIYLLMFIS